MKKITTVLVALLMTFVLAFAACGGNNNSGSSSTGGEVDKSKFPNYVELEDAAYAFDLEQKVTPYWTGNVIYNETVMLLNEGGVISAKLQYAPLKVLSVRDYTWEKEYPVTDYKIEGNVITLTNTESEMPYLNAGVLNNKDFPEEYRQVGSVEEMGNNGYMIMGGTFYTETDLIYGHQISVSYVYDVRDLKTSDFASYETSGFEKTKAKLTAGEPLKIVALGDSVAEGCSSSSHFNHEPFLPNWVNLVKQGLEAKYDSAVTVDNQAVGGKTSDWGCGSAQLSKLKAANPDLVILHFGINDLGVNTSANGYKENMEAIVLDVQTVLPNCEFMIVKAFTPNDKAYNPNSFAQYWKKMDDLAAGVDNTFTLDMWTMSRTLLETKKYFDVTGNGINHINDYGTRLYAMNILSALIKY